MRRVSWTSRTSSLVRVVRVRTENRKWNDKGDGPCEKGVQRGTSKRVKNKIKRVYSGGLGLKFTSDGKDKHGTFTVVYD